MNTTIFFGMALFGLSNFAYANGNLTAHCKEAKKITNPTGAQGYFLDKDCSVAYVLPPSSGKVEVLGSSSGDLKLCKEIRNRRKVLEASTLKLKAAIEGSATEEEIKAILDQRNLDLEHYDQIGQREGATINFLFSTRHEDLVQKYKDLNRNLRIDFRPVQLKDVKLNWNLSRAEMSDSPSAIPNSESMIDIGNGSFNGLAQLTLAGACELRSPFDFKFPTQPKFKEIAGLIAPTVTYKYEINANCRYKAEAHKGALASRIRSSSSKGGLFRTSTSSSLIEDQSSSSWFKLDMTCDDSRIKDQAMKETALQIKTRLMNEVLEGIVLARIGIPAKPFETPEPGQNGASAASNALRSNCGLAWQCQTGAAILDVGSAIFGGSSKTDTYISKNNHWAAEEVQESWPVSFMGIMGFRD